MEEQLVGAIEKAIGELVAEFQGDPDRYFNERDMHWSLFHHLRRQDVFKSESASGLIRAEFPTRAVYEGRRPARGHYDLAVLDPDSLADPRVAGMKPWDEWAPYLEIVRVLVAVEVKAWSDRRKHEERVDWDVEKLTDPRNPVKHAYLLNFVQLDFERPPMRDFYQTLREYLAVQARRWPQLRVLCVPSDTGIQPDAGENWIPAQSVEE